MKAELLPLQGKYYGTRVKITDEETGHSWIEEIWIMGNHKPSERELEGYEFRDGKWVTYHEEWYDGEPAWIEYEICDSHYETETCLEVARRLVDSINGESE